MKNLSGSSFLISSVTFVFERGLLARGKKPMQATVAVMRKLLHSIYGMLKHQERFDGQKFYAISHLQA